MKNFELVYVLLVLVMISCGRELPEISPDIITEATKFDTDDPAIWVNYSNPSESIVFGTDKDETNGGIFAFDLDGKIIQENCISGLKYPNNVDVEYGFKLNDSTFTDILMFSEREANKIRLFSIPDMKPLDNGGFPVFTDETDVIYKRPMGISLYKSLKTEKIYAIVSRKEGPKEGYLYQYELVADSVSVQANLVRKFGNFSGKKEIEAIAVDDKAGIVYYSDEQVCIRKYYAEPSKGNEEIACFGGEHFKEDIEGIAIARYDDKGFIIVSNQQRHTFNIFDLETNDFIKEINLGTVETDGCELTTMALGDKYPNGLFVSMNDDKTFFYHDLKSLTLLE